MRIARHFIRYLWLTFALVVIVYALLVVAGRELLPVIHRYQPQINAWLSQQTGLDIEIRSLTGAWSGSSPLLALHEVVITGRGDNPTAVAVDRLDAEISLGKSVANLTPVWRELTAGRIEINLVEDERGRWSLGGYPLSLGAGERNLDYLLRMFYYSRLLRTDQLVVELHFYAGTRAQLFARDLQVENQGGFHRTVATIALSERGDAVADFVFEGTGDPAKPDFSGRGYLHLKRLNMEGTLRTLAAAWFPDLAEQFDRMNTDLDLAFWFDWRESAVRNGRGYLKAGELPLPLVPGAPPLQQLNAEITGWFQPGEDWGFQVQGMTARWRGAQIEPVDAKFRQRVGRHWGELDFAVSRLDLALAAQTLSQTRLLGDRGEEILASLQPTGLARALFLDVDFSRSAPRFRVRTNLDGVAIGSWKGTPAARGLSGYVETGPRQGFAIIDAPEGLALRYPQAYDNYMNYGRTRGKVAWEWRPEEEQVLLTSNRIAIDGPEGQATVAFHLEQPTTQGEEPAMYLMVGLRNSHTRYVERYLPRMINPNLATWLDSAIGEGEIPEAGVIWRGSLAKTNHSGRSIQIFARLEDGDVAYQPGWPEASGVAATLIVDNREMDVRVARAVIAGEVVEDIAVSLRQPPSGPLLRVVGELDSSVETGIEVLSRSPLQASVSAITALEASGNLDLALDLAIPLTENRENAAYLVGMELRDAALTLPGTSHRIEGITGHLSYRHGRGLDAGRLDARLWGEPLQLAIKDTGEGVRIHGNGALTAEGLGALLGAGAARVTGRTRVNAELLLPPGGGASGSVLSLNSNLEGLAVDLPAPFGKAAETSLPAQLKLDFTAGEVTARGSVQDTLAVAGIIREGALARGAVELLAGSARLPDSDHLRVAGHLPAVDWAQWEAVFGAESLAVERSGSPPDLRIDLQLADLVAGRFSLGSTRLRGQIKGRKWNLAVESPRLAGEAVLAGDAPPALRLDYLKLPAEESPGTSRGTRGADVLGALSPQEIPELDISVRELFFGDELWGNLALKTRRLPRGVLFTDLEGELRGISIQSQPLAEDGNVVDPAQLQWTVTEGGNNSFFSGTLVVASMEAAMASWGAPVPFSSEGSTFFVNLGWEGKPWQISTLKLDGYLGLDLRKGVFHETEGSAANALFKLVGLINFDTWLRRLRFDFSDFFSEGLSFDKVEGGLVFNKGLVEFHDPVIASLPGGKIRLLGNADLVYEQLDARLIATMPVGTNLPWVAGLLGGLPAAAGVYLTSKLFEKQVDQLSSIGYRVTGPLDDPEIEVQQIFTDPTSLSPRADNSGE